VFNFRAIYDRPSEIKLLSGGIVFSVCEKAIVSFCQRRQPFRDVAADDRQPADDRLERGQFNFEKQSFAVEKNFPDHYIVCR
jgi:hypothetical protein